MRCYFSSDCFCCVDLICTYSNNKIFHKFTDSVMSNSSLSDVSSKKKDDSRKSPWKLKLCHTKSCIPIKEFYLDTSSSAQKNERSLPEVSSPEKATSLLNCLANLVSLPSCPVFDCLQMQREGSLVPRLSPSVF